MKYIIKENKNKVMKNQIKLM